MKYPLFSLTEDAPREFAFRQRLSNRDVRRTAFAVFADSVENAEERLRPYSGKIAGLIVTYADEYTWEQRGPLLFHLGVLASFRDSLAELVDGLLEAVEMLQKKEDIIRQRTTGYLRCLKDGKRIESDFARSRESLLEEIAERTRSEQSLRESEERFRTIFDSVNDAIILFDQKTGAIRDVNRRMCELFGYSHDEALLLDFQAIGPSEASNSQNEASEWMKNAVTIGPQIFECQCRKKSGNLFWAEVSVRSALIRKQECLLLTIRDVSDRKEGELERERLSRELQTALAAKVKQLSGFLPICMSCKKIRDDKGYWNQVESYIRNHSGAEFSHCLCPECAKKMYPGFKFAEKLE